MTPPRPSDQAYRDAMARFATGVTVMTTTVDGEPHGMTANAVSSVSLEPLLLLVCVERGTKMAELVERAEAFCLSVLNGGQRRLSEHFADPERPFGRPEFAGVEVARWGEYGPVLGGALSWFECRTWRIHDGGDHLIVVGEVVDLGLGAVDDALLYFEHAYLRTGGADDAAP